MDHDCIITLSFEVFMVEFHANYLSEDWEEDTLHELLSMTQGSTWFWDFLVAMQSKNSLLCRTLSHLPDDKLCHQINAGMEIRLSKKLSSEKQNERVDFHKWLNEVRRCNDGLRAEREEDEHIPEDNHDLSCHTHYSNDPSSHCTPYNSNSNNQTTNTSNATASSTTCKQCPK